MPVADSSSFWLRRGLFVLFDGAWGVLAVTSVAGVDGEFVVPPDAGIADDAPDVRLF